MYGFMEWEDRFAVNVSKVDAQHRELIRMIRDLHAAMVEKTGQAALAPLIDRMAEYAVSHFALEEEYMQKTGYRGFAAHKQEHADFIEKVSNLQERLLRNSFVLSLEVITFLREWLTNHILKTDKAFGPFLNSKGIY